MTKAKDKSAGKVILLDYDFIETMDEETKCRCISERTIQMLLTMTEFLFWDKRWYGENVDHEKIQIWAGKAVRELMDDCDCEGEKGDKIGRAHV